MSGDTPPLYEMFDDRFGTGRCMNGDDRLEVESTYSGFRRFDVTVDEEIKMPK